MSHRPIPTTPTDVTAAIVNIVKSALLTGESAGSKRTGNDARFVLVRADLQGRATPITRYCRVGLTAFYTDAAGNVREDLAFDLCARAGRALLDATNSVIVSAEWQSGPLDTTDPITEAPVAYATVLLEVLDNL